MESQLPSPSQLASMTVPTLRTIIPSSQQQFMKQCKSNRKKLDIDGLNLVSNGTARFPTLKEIQVLQEKLPNAKSIGVVPPMINVECENLPCKPWPLTVAGLPLRFVEDRWDALGVNHGYPGGSKTEYLTNCDARGGLIKLALEAIIECFEIELQVAITSVANIGSQLEITVPDDTNLSTLPIKVANCGISYQFASRVEAPQIGTMELPFHVTVIWDRSKYAPLRPGTMINIGSKSAAAILVTSGVAVEDDTGTRYFTTAGKSSSRKRLPCQNLGEPRIPRKIYHHLKDPNISIVKLLPDESYENKTFCFKPCSSRIIPGLPIRGVLDPFQLPLYSILVMDSAFSGYCECIHIGFQKMKALGGGWVTKHWMYFGTSLLGPLEGCAGTPILDKEGMLISLLEHIWKDGIGIGVAASEVERYGYKIVLETKGVLEKEEPLSGASGATHESVSGKMEVPRKPFTMTETYAAKRKAILDERAASAWDMLVWDAEKGTHKVVKEDLSSGMDDLGDDPVQDKLWSKTERNMHKRGQDQLVSFPHRSRQEVIKRKNLQDAKTIQDEEPVMAQYLSHEAGIAVKAVLQKLLSQKSDISPAMCVRIRPKTSLDEIIIRRNNFVETQPVAAKPVAIPEIAISQKESNLPWHEVFPPSYPVPPQQFIALEKSVGLKENIIQEEPHELGNPNEGFSIRPPTNPSPLNENIPRSKPDAPTKPAANIPPWNFVLEKSPALKPKVTLNQLLALKNNPEPEDLVVVDTKAIVGREVGLDDLMIFDEQELLQDEGPVQEESPLEPPLGPLGSGDGNRNEDRNGNVKFWYDLEHEDVIMQDEDDDENDLMSFL